MVGGMTVLGSELFVVRYGSPHLNVYNTNTFAWTRNITIADSVVLRSIVASLAYNCLYISDDELKVVHRYDLESNVLTNWSIGGNCYGLSLTSTNNVLVTLGRTRQIVEYTPAGVLIREITLDSSIEHPMHSVALSSDRFVVSHRGSQHRVCIVNTNGSIVQCYGGVRGENVGQLRYPGSLAVDQHDNVLVGDYSNDRVVLLSPSLTHLGYIHIPGYKLRVPYALCLDKLTHRLYIGEWVGTGRVFVLTA